MEKFKFNETSIDGVYIIEPTVFGDNRGYFMETYQKEKLSYPDEQVVHVTLEEAKQMDFGYMCVVVV